MWQDCATHSEGRDTLPVSWSSQWRTHQRKWGSWGFHALCDIPSGGSLNGSHNPATTQGKSQNESDNVKDCSFQLPKCNDLNLFFVIYDGDEVSLVFELLAGPQKQSEDVTLGSDEKSFIIFDFLSHKITFVVNWRLTNKDWLINGGCNILIFRPIDSETNH